MKSRATNRDHKRSLEQGAQADEICSLFYLIDVVKGIYEGTINQNDPPMRALLAIDPQRTKTARDRVFDELVFKAVQFATREPLAGVATVPTPPQAISPLWRAPRPSSGTSDGRKDSPSDFREIQPIREQTDMPEVIDPTPS